MASSVPRRIQCPICNGDVVQNPQFKARILMEDEEDPEEGDDIHVPTQARLCIDCGYVMLFADIASPDEIGQ